MARQGITLAVGWGLKFLGADMIAGEIGIGIVFVAMGIVISWNAGKEKE